MRELADKLVFEKMSHFDRESEPITFGIPFPKGALTRPEQFILRDGAEVFCQKHITAAWDDHSIRWLLVHCLVDLPGGDGKTFHFTCGDREASANPPAPSVSAIDGEDEISLDTGVLQIAIPKKNFNLFRSVAIDGWELRDVFSGFNVVDEHNRAYSTAEDTEARVEIEEDGPVRAVAKIAGKHRAGADTLLDYVVRIYAWAGKPYAMVEYQFINCEEREALSLKEIGLRCQLPFAEEVALTSGEGHYRTAKNRSAKEVEISVDGRKMLRYASEHLDQCYFGDFWVDWNGPRGGLALTMRQAQQNFPKRLRATMDGIEAYLYPQTEDPLTIYQGVAKTHQILLHFHKANPDIEEISRRSLQFQLPDHPALSSQWYQQSGVWEDVFSGRRYGRIEALLADVIDTRPIGLGVMSFGDEFSHGYTWQGRGDGKPVWLNGEYDMPHLLFLQHARTGRRRFFESGRALAQHWVDVDFCHYSPDPLRMGALIAHSADHVSGGVSVSHQWIEGFVDYYHLTGKKEAYEAAIAIGDNFIRHLEQERYEEAGRYQARDLGWMLRGLVGLYRETGEGKYLRYCKEIVERFKDWQQSMGGFLAPYTDHTRIRVPFMIAIALNALKSYHQIAGDASVKDLILRETDALLEHTLTEDGLFYYKEWPSIQYNMNQTLILESLAYAYRLTRNEDYILKGMRTLEYILINMNFRLVMNTGAPQKTLADGSIIKETLPFPPGGQHFATTLFPLLHFLAVADELDLLEPLDFTY